MNRLHKLIKPIFNTKYSTSISKSSNLINYMYELSPTKLGATVHGIDLNQNVDIETIEKIKKDVLKHRILIFKNQGSVSGARHLQISKWFGEIDSTFYQHEKSPDKDVFRVSNDHEEGCTNVGRTGWHIDGSFQKAPFNYSLYHIVNVPSKGNTGLLLHYNIHNFHKNNY